MSIVFGWVDLIAYERGGVEPAFVRRHWLHSLPAYAASVLYLGSFLWRWRTQNRLSGALVTLSVLAAILSAEARIKALPRAAKLALVRDQRLVARTAVP